METCCYLGRFKRVFDLAKQKSVPHHIIASAEATIPLIEEAFDSTDPALYASASEKASSLLFAIQGIIDSQSIKVEDTCFIGALEIMEKPDLNASEVFTLLRFWTKQISFTLLEDGIEQTIINLGKSSKG